MNPRLTPLAIAIMVVGYGLAAILIVFTQVNLVAVLAVGLATTAAVYTAIWASKH